MSYIKPISKKGKDQIKLDEATYQEVWDNSDCCCEECGTWLGDDFRINGKVNNKSFYSHILGKGAFPEFRNDPRNFNLLCPSCHSNWEFWPLDKKEKMNIWEGNQITIQMLKDEYNGKTRVF